LGASLCVPLCGDSVLSAAIADSLKTPDLQVACITSYLPDRPEQILACPPDGVPIECRPDQDSRLMLALLQAFPALPLIQRIQP